MSRQIRSLVKLFISSWNGTQESDPVLLLLKHISDSLDMDTNQRIPVDKIFQLSLLCYSLRNSTADSNPDIKLREDILNTDLGTLVSRCIHLQYPFVSNDKHERLSAHQI